ncbi:hypothetical protein FACS1894120_0300 [Clostridia bacterium]|nr:hypothetical protein FACS1894120_0300 [Clostridia bacterium]
MAYSAEIVKREQRKKGLTLRHRFGIITCLGAIVLAFAVAGVSLYIYEATIREMYERQANSMFSLAGEVIDWDNFDGFISDDSSPRYSQARKLMISLAKDFGADYIYVCVPEENGLRLVMDSAEDWGTAEYDDLYGDNSQDTDFLYYGDDFKSHKYVSVITNDSYGYYMSVYLPRYDSAGEFKAYIALDFPVEIFVNMRREYTTTLLAVVLLLTAVVVVISVSFVDRWAGVPIKRLYDGTGEFLREILGDDAEKLIGGENRRDEISELTAAVTMLQWRVTQNLSGLSETGTYDKAKSLHSEEFFISDMREFFLSTRARAKRSLIVEPIASVLIILDLTDSYGGSYLERLGSGDTARVSAMVSGLFRVSGGAGDTITIDKGTFINFRHGNPDKSIARYIVFCKSLGDRSSLIPKIRRIFSTLNAGLTELLPDAVIKTAVSALILECPPPPSAPGEPPLMFPTVDSSIRAAYTLAEQTGQGRCVVKDMFKEAVAEQI